jgi:hypothetical protein
MYCKDCKYFSVVSEKDYRTNRFGFCNNIKEYGWYDYQNNDDSVATTNCNDDCSFIVGKNFGCINFEQKPSGEAASV